MSYFCVRDDDTSYFTSPSDLESAWDWWPHEVTLGAIPYVVESKYVELQNRDYSYHQLGDTEFALSKNLKICDYLRKNQNKFSIAMHGCTHRYHIYENRLIAEYSSLESNFLKRETDRGLKELLNCFGYSPKIFIPPDNAISWLGLQIVHGAGFTFVQTPFPIAPDSINWFKDYSRSFGHWLGRTYIRIFKETVDLRVCGDGSERIGAAILVKFKNEDFLYKQVNLAVSNRWPITLATHYWEMLDENYRRKFARLTEFLIECGLEPVSMEELYCKKNS
jgi:peptidoglycan/xylan/chitin deacetylase (PgdA/CDA1 family)